MDEITGVIEALPKGTTILGGNQSMVEFWK